MKHLSLLLLSSILATQAHAAVYGFDDRREAGNDPQMSEIARSTAMMISPVYYTTNAKGLIDLNIPTLDSPDGSANVCSDERFAKQPAGQLACTGFLIAPDLLVTAGHCTVNFGAVENASTAFCDSFTWLFDFKVKPDGTVQTKDIPQENMVRCKTVISAKLTNDYDQATDHFTFHEDYALIQLEHAMPGRTPLTLAPTITPGAALSMVGYSSGLPVKSTHMGRVTDNTPTSYFHGNLSALGGDSGAPVFNAKNEVVGILIRSFPDPDFTDSNEVGHPELTCSRVNICDINMKNCKTNDRGDHPYGSDIERINVISDLLKARQ